MLVLRRVYPAPSEGCKVLSREPPKGVLPQRSNATLFFLNLNCLYEFVTTPYLSPTMSKNDPLLTTEMEKRLAALRSLFQGSKRSMRKWAEIIEIGPSALADILNGKRDPRFSTIVRIEVAVRQRREEE